MNDITTQHQSPTGCQPVTVINNIYNKPPKEEGGYLPGRSLYRALEGTVHVMLYSSVAAINGTAQPIYHATYATAFVAGAAFGLYQAMHGNCEVGLEERAKAFAEGESGTKALMIAEVAMEGPLAIAGLETISHADRSIFGGLVVGSWAFSLGSDLSKWAYKTIKSDKQ